MIKNAKNFRFVGDLNIIYEYKIVGVFLQSLLSIASTLLLFLALLVEFEFVFEL